MKSHKLLLLALTTVVMTLFNTAFAAPATVVQSVTYNSETITMRMDRQNLRGANFELWSQNAAGTYDVIAPVDERSYIGTVDGYPGAVSCGILQDDGTFRGAVYFDRGVSWFTLGTAVVETRALGYGTFSAFQVPSSSTVGAGQAGSTMYGYELGVDADHDFYTTAGSSVAKAFEQIEYSVCAMRAIYMRDALLRPYLGRVIVRSTLAHDPYTGLTQGGYLDKVRSEWENNQTSTNPDLAAGVSPTKIGGGLAWVGVVGTGSGYSVNQSGGTGAFDVVGRHELGHNWGCGHFVGGSPEGTGIMGGNAPGRFSGPEIHNILDHRDAKITAGGILDAEGTFTAVELPPYASLDVATFIQTVDTSVNINVLANDHDANGQTISLVSFDSTSAQGGTITQQGQDLVYTAQGAYLGTDYFKYLVTDTAGKTATGVVTIDVQLGRALKVYLPLDETSGTTVVNEASIVQSGVVENGGVVGVSGKFGNAVTLDGIDDRITLNNLNLYSDTVTLAGWIKRPSTPQASFAGLIFNGAGLNFGTANELRYHWNGTNWSWNSGLVPPADQWVFVALVIEPTQATIYMHDGTTLQSAVNVGTHTAEEFAGTTSIGSDPARGDRDFTGDVDEVRIYKSALTQAQIQELVDGGSAAAPDPFDGAIGVSTPSINWAPGASATSYQVYVGTSQAAVASANTGSPEYQGSVTDSNSVFDLQANTGYFWRIDTVTASSTITGAVWSFTTGAIVYESGLIAHWKMDDGSGTITADSSSNTNEGTLNGSSWDIGYLGGAISFDGVDDSVTFGNGPALSGQTDFTLSAWIKTSASSEQVIIQQRDAGGFNGQYAFRVNSSGQLNFYLYGNSAEQFNFNTTATVNDGQWHFVSAVRDGQNGYIYIDGNPVAAATASGTIRDLASSIGVGIGRDIRDNNKPFNGLIDEAKIYNLAQTGQQLTDIFNAYQASLNHAPVANDATFAVAENSNLGASIGTVSATDPDAGDTLTYTIIAGNTNGAFVINSNTGAITVSGVLNYEVLNNYSLTVEVTDSGSLTDTATVTVNVTDVDESALTGIQAWEEAVHQGATFAHKRTTALAGNATATVDLSGISGDATYEFVVDAEDLGQAAVHLLDGNGWSLRLEQWSNSGKLGVTRYGVADYQLTAEAGQSVASPYGAVHHIVYVVDSGSSQTRVYVDGVLVGTVSQVPILNTVSMTLGSSNLRGDSTTGIYAFAAYNTTLAAAEIATHSTAWFGAPSNSAPVADDATFTVAEDVAIGSSVGTVVASDPDAGDTLSYAITGGNTGTAFAIDSSGNITTAATLDYETTDSYTLTVTVTDNGSLTDTATVTVTVTDVLEITAPVVSTGAASSITQTSANVAYSVTDDGGEDVTVTVYYGETNGGTTAANWANNVAAGTLSTGSYSSTLSGLTEGATYYYSVHASNSAGEAWGSSGSFTTEADTSPKLVRTTVNGVGNGSWTNVNLGQNYNSAVIIATPIYPNSTIAPVVTRVRNVSGSSFEVKIDRTDGLTGAVSVDVSIVAVEEGVYTQAADGVTMEAVKYTSTVTGAKNAWTAENRSYQNSYTNPVVVGQVMSANDANWSTFWCHGSSRTNPPNAGNLNVGKQVAEDLNTTRANETVGYIVIESGNGTINGVNYSAGVGSDIVRGTGNTSVGYDYSLSGLSSASAAAASLAGLDGGDGGWAVLYGASPMSATTLTLAVDEDQLSNSERNHTTEQVGYIVFE